MGGQLTGTTLERGTLYYQYDAMTGNPIQLSTPEGKTVSYQWDGALPTSQSWLGEVSGTVSQQWDNNFWLSQRCVSGSVCVGFGYDDDGLLTQAGDLALTRDADTGLLDGSELGDLAQAHDYNGFGERTDTTITHADSTVGSLSYEYDELGNLLKATLPGDVVIDYVVDGQNRRIGKKVNGALTQGFILRRRSLKRAYESG